MKKPEKILMVNFGGIGDEILFLPAISSIKKEFPDSKITLALEPRSKSVKDLSNMIDDVMFTTIAYIDFGLVASTISFMLLISSTDGTISAVYKMFEYVKSDQISLFQKVDGAFGVTTDYGDTNNINGLTFYFDTINGKPIIHRDTTVNSYNIPTITFED